MRDCRCVALFFVLSNVCITACRHSKPAPCGLRAVIGDKRYRPERAWQGQFSRGCRSLDLDEAECQVGEKIRARHARGACSQCSRVSDPAGFFVYKTQHVRKQH